ncbi:MAG: guided entry of tail-anchored proteins factor 1 [Marinisporobacter sp.]|jgi:chromosome segregation ATPase|nr:guided entry of tail-anchored proteins factor 1 [Marinisporobacter sp.]
MEQEILKLILSKLDNIEREQQEMRKEQQEMKKEQQGMKMRQDEMYIMQGGIEENIKITRAEQEKMQFTLADIQGKVTALTNKVKKHDNVINQIRAIK